MTQEEKSTLIKGWLKAKKAEDAAKKRRYDIEATLLHAYPAFDEKSKTFKEDGFSVNIKTNIAVKFDQDKYLSIRPNIPEDLRPEKITFALDMKGYNFLKENKKDLYKLVSDCVEFKENKSTISIEKIK